MTINELNQRIPSTINDDLRELNLQFLMTLRESVRTNPTESIWIFNLKKEDLNRISRMTTLEVKELAGCGRAVLTILPMPTKQNTPLNILAALTEIEEH